MSRASYLRGACFLEWKVKVLTFILLLWGGESLHEVFLDLPLSPWEEGYRLYLHMFVIKLSHPLSLFKLSFSLFSFAPNVQENENAFSKQLTFLIKKILALVRSLFLPTHFRTCSGLLAVSTVGVWGTHLYHHPHSVRILPPWVHLCRSSNRHSKIALKSLDPPKCPARSFYSLFQITLMPLISPHQALLHIPHFCQCVLLTSLEISREVRYHVWTQIAWTT